MNSPLSIKSMVLKSLRESAEPLFYLAPDVVGSINNAYAAKNKKLVVIDFNTIDDKNMKLVVPRTCYKNYASNNQPGESGMAHGFLMKFLDGIRPYQDSDGTLDEIVDEFGDIYDGKDDLPANIKGSPGQGQTKSSDSKRQFVAQYTRMISPLGYGGVVW